MNNLMNLKRKKLMNLKKNDKGFTLIEMVIVLVIIAILVAILVPSMMGWIRDAKHKSFQSQARNVYTAVASEVTDQYVATDIAPGAIDALDKEHSDSLGEKLTTVPTKEDCFWGLDTNKMTTFTYIDEKNGFQGVFDVKKGTWEWKWDWKK